MPMMPLAPGRFRITIDWPSIGAAACASERIMVSVLLPAPAGTTSWNRPVRIGLSPHSQRHRGYERGK